MERDQHMNMLEKIKTERLYFHFVVLLASLFYLLQQNIQFQSETKWYIWIITIWFFFSITLIKVFITDRFMNKNWEREQLDRLISLQKKK
jgi:hypothetical protein